MLLKIDGQPINFSHENKIVQIDLVEPFYSASKKLNWSIKSPGLGINEGIINLVLKTKSTLVINILSAGVKYWINWDHIQSFMQNNNCTWRVRGGVCVIVIPWRQTVRKQEHMQGKLF